MPITLDWGSGKSANEPLGFGKVLLDRVVIFLWDSFRGIHYVAAKVLELGIGTAEGDGIGKPVIT